MRVVKLRQKELRIIEEEGGLFVVKIPLLVRVKAGTLRQAFVKFGNACKRLKKEELEKIWET